MFYRLLGKLFFYFYVLPFIIDTLRLVRKTARPALLVMAKEARERVQKDLADIVKEDPTPPRSE